MSLFIDLIIASLIIAKVPSIDAQLAFINSAPKVCKFRVSSGYRSKEHNERVGGSPNSLHLFDRARDIVTNCRSWLRMHALDKGLSVILYPSHIHVDNREGQVCLIKVKGGFKYCRK